MGRSGAACSWERTTGHTICLCRHTISSRAKTATPNTKYAMVTLSTKYLSCNAGFGFLLAVVWGHFWRLGFGFFWGEWGVCVWFCIRLVLLDYQLTGPNTGLQFPMGIRAFLEHIFQFSLIQKKCSLTTLT